MRAIDADAFKSQISAVAMINNYNLDLANTLCALIDKQKTLIVTDDEVINKI